MTEYKKIDCLDKGFVRLVDHMGDDSSIVQMARVSYGKGTKKVSEDRSLIRYLLRKGHTSPFEGVTFKFHVRAPIFVVRQWHRHRTWSYNEMSGRYSVMPDDCYVPKEEHVTTQDPNNKQGGTTNIVPFTEDDFQYGADTWPKRFELCQDILRDDYNHFLSRGMRRELARANLPLSQYTEMYAVVNLHNLLHFLRLRIDSHAQYEIRVFAQALYDSIKSIVPITLEAFDDYIVNSQTFTSLDIDVISQLFEMVINSYPEKGRETWQKGDVRRGLNELAHLNIKNKRECRECIDKIKIILSKINFIEGD